MTYVSEYVSCQSSAELDSIKKIYKYFNFFNGPRSTHTSFAGLLTIDFLDTPSVVIVSVTSDLIRQIFKLSQRNIRINLDYFQLLLSLIPLKRLKTLPERRKHPSCRLYSLWSMCIILPPTMQHYLSNLSLLSG